MATSAQQMRSYDGHPVLSAGFRPFFLAASAWSALIVPIWIWFYSGHGVGVSMSWHAHEMVFGYVGGIVGGFLLTAVPNWTGRLPVTGLPLLALFSLWNFGRLAMVLPAWSGVAAMAADCAFLVVFAALVWREILTGRNWRNLPVAVMITVLAICNIAYHAGAGMASIRIALAVILTLISLIGGRIIPSFTTNWLKKQKIASLPAAFSKFDLFIVILTGTSLVVWASDRLDVVAGCLLCAAGGLNMVRLVRWRGLSTSGEPLVWILHIGYAWLAIGLLLLGMATLHTASGFGPDVSQQSGLHALTAGAIGVMTLAVMTRASLGHTGRPLVADQGTTILYLLVNLAAAVRVLAGFAPQFYLPGLVVSSLLWTGAFGGFCILYGPALLKPRWRSPDV
ncbi:hypothetical protein ABAC460_17045 [Asticcacaulis sp. AC460]|uniref:NnrS family protein n=1 Tax=Asticcacaulis sp. AC460 TaxID=1282360 RepID=UPI0003C3AC71|nr:NnrS family protein [Asticcacaulis sp. AC460]ESQ87897.1 hypothetical protein ABAC460_17045 [Asticcacaulis sp. AC460]